MHEPIKILPKYAPKRSDNGEALCNLGGVTVGYLGKYERESLIESLANEHSVSCGKMVEHVLKLEQYHDSNQHVALPHDWNAILRSGIQRHVTKYGFGFAGGASSNGNKKVAHSESSPHRFSPTAMKASKISPILDKESEERDLRAVEREDYSTEELGYWFYIVNGKIPIFLNTYKKLKEKYEIVPTKEALRDHIIILSGRDRLSDIHRNAMVPDDTYISTVNTTLVSETYLDRSNQGSSFSNSPRSLGSVLGGFDEIPF